MSAGKIFAGIAVALGLGGLAYWAVTSKVKPKKTEPDAPAPTPTTPTSPSPTSPTSPTSGVFPLIVGMTKNENVRKMQQALMDKFSVIISAGATGNFGAQTVSALKSAGYSTIVSKADYDAILKGLKKGQEEQDPNALKKGDKVRANNYAKIYAVAGGIGDIGWLKRGQQARYEGAATSNWAKITTIDYWVKGPKDANGNDTELYKFNQRTAYVRSNLIQKA